MSNSSHRRRLDPASYPQSVRDRVQIDYARKLSPQERQWLASFNEAEYGGNPRCLEDITGVPLPATERKRLYREIKRYQRDTLTRVEWTQLHFCKITINPEDGLIDMIDAALELEALICRHLKQIIRDRDWSIWAIQEGFYVEAPASAQ